MDEKWIEGLYNQLGGQGRMGSFEAFKTAISTDDEYRRGIYNTLGEANLGTYDSFESLVKKKDGGTTSSPSSTQPSPAQPAGISTVATPQKITSLWDLDESGKPSSLIQNDPTAFLNRRQRTEFARNNGYVLSRDAQRELASAISESPVTSAQKQRDALIEVVGADFDEYLAAESWRQKEDLKAAGYSDELATTEGGRLAREKLMSEGRGDAIAYVNDALSNGDYKALRERVNNYYGRRAAKITEKYTADPEGINWVLQGIQAAGWDGVYDESEEELGPLRHQKNMANLAIDNISASQYSYTNQSIKDQYEQDAVGRNKKMNSVLSPNQYSGLRYFQENNPEMYANMMMEISKGADPDLFGKDTYDTNNRDYQYMLYQLDKKGAEINGMSINSSANDLMRDKQAVDVDYRSKLSNVMTRIQTTNNYDEQKALQAQLQTLQEEYATNPVIQKFNSLSQDANALEVNFAQKYPDYVSRARERMVKDILGDNLKGDNWFTKLLETNYDKFSWMVGDTGDFLGNITGISEGQLGASRNYFRDLRRSEEKQDVLYQPAGTSAVEAMYKLNFNAADFATIKSIENSDLSTDEKANAVGAYLDANRDRIQYIENPNVGKRNWTLGAIGNQLSDVGTQIIYQAGLTYLTSGFGRAAAGVNTEARALASSAAAARTEAAALSGFEAAGANVAADVIGGVNQAGLAFKSKIINLGSLMGATYATAYQPAYVQALQEGKSEEEASAYANEIAMVNAISETISPDIEIVKRAGRGIRGLASDLTPEMLTNAKRYNMRAFAKGYVGNMVPETLEEIAAAYGEYGVDALNNMSLDEQNSLGSRIQDAAITTMIGMAPWGLAAGVSSYRANSPFQREAFYQAGLYPDMVKAEIQQLIDEGGLSQQEGNRRIQVVNTMRDIVNSLPNLEDGTPLNDQEKQWYAYNQAQVFAYTNQLEKAKDPNAQRQIQKNIDALTVANQQILDGSMRTPGQEPGTEQPVVSAEAAVESTTTVEQQPEAEVESAPKYVPGSTLQTADQGDLKIISENNGVYTIETPDGQTDEFTAQEITDLIAPTNVISNETSPASQEAAATNLVVPPQEAAAAPVVQQQAPRTKFVSRKNPVQDIFQEDRPSEDILNDVVQLTDNEFLREQAANLTPYLKKNPGIKFAKMFTVGAGEASPTGEWTVNLSRIANDNKLAQVVTHELYHAVSMNEVNNNQKFADSVMGFVQQARQKLGLSDDYFDVDNIEFTTGRSRDRKYYGLLNPHEFIAEVFTNKDFAQMIDDIIIERDKTLLDKIIDAIKNTLGLGGKKTTSQQLRDVILKGLPADIALSRDDIMLQMSAAQRGAARNSDFEYNPIYEEVEVEDTTVPDENTNNGSNTNLPVVDTDIDDITGIRTGESTDSGSGDTGDIPMSQDQEDESVAGGIQEQAPTAAVETQDIQEPAEEAQLEIIDESGELTPDQQADITSMSLNQLYEGILQADPSSVVRGSLSRYNRAELEALYRGALAAQTDGDQAVESSTLEQQDAVRSASAAVNEAKNLVKKRKDELAAIKKKDSVDYQVKKKFLDSANAKLRTAESNYIKELAAANTRLLREKRGNLNSGVPFGRQDAQIIANYVKMARIFLDRGIRSLAEFASKLGESVNDHMRRAWQIATAVAPPTQQEGESYKQFLTRLRAWEQQQVAEVDEEDFRAQAAEMRLGVKQLSQGIELLDTDPYMVREEFNEQLGLEPNNYETYVAALKWAANDKSPVEHNARKDSSRQILNNLRATNPKLITATEMGLLRKQMGALERGNDIGYDNVRDQVREIQAEIRGLLKSLYDSKLLESGNFTDKDLIRMGNMINNAMSETGIQNLSDFFQQLIDNSSLSRTVNDIAALQKRLAKLLKAKDTITANMLRKNKINSKAIMAAMKGLNPLEITEKLRFAGMLDNLVNSLEGKELLVTSNDELLNFLDGQSQVKLQNRADQLKKRYQDTIEIADENASPYRVNEVISQEEFDMMVDTVMNNRELSNQGKMNEMKALHNAVLSFERQIERGTSSFVSLPDIYDQIKEVGSKPSSSPVKNRLLPMIKSGQMLLQVALEASDFNATPQQRDWVNSMVRLDVETMNNKELSLFKNAIDNIFVNNDFSGTEAYDAKYKGQQRVSRIVDWAVEKKIAVPKDAFTSVGGKLVQAISSTDAIVSYVTNNNVPFSVKLMDATALGDIKAQHAQAKQTMDSDVVRPLKEIYRRHKDEDLRKAESNFKRSMFAYLSENNFGNVDDVQREFDRRKGLIQQDIKMKAGSPEADNQEEAKTLGEVYNKYFAGITSYPQLQDAEILTKGEREVYDLFRNFYDAHKEEFRQVTEALLNRPFNDVNNYVRDAYKVLRTNASDISLDDIGSSSFIPPANPNVASNATLERNTFYDLNNVPVVDNTGREVGKRVINHDFDNTQLNNATAMLEDIYTLKTRMEAKEALADPRLRDVLGYQNVSVMAKNVENQVLSQMRMRNRGVSDAFFDEFAEKTANTINGIGVRQVLYSVSQMAKQPVDIIANTVIQLGKDADYFWLAMVDHPFMVKHKEGVDDLLAQSEIALRGKTFGGTDWANPRALTEISNTLKQIGKNADLKDADKLSWLIEAPDTWGARAAWLAYYAKSLKQQGLIKKYKQIDWKKEAANINREARDYAQLMTSTRLNVNSKESQSEFYAKAHGIGRLARVMALPLSSFSMNNYAMMARDIRAVYSGETKQQKIDSLKSVASRMVAELAYQSARVGVSVAIKGAANTILETFGVEPPPKRELQFWKRVLSESVLNLFFGMLGNHSHDFFAEQINNALGDDTILHMKENPNQKANTLGALNLAINPLTDAYDYMKDVIGTKSKDGEPVVTTPGEKVILTTAALMNVFAAFGMMEDDTKRAFNAAAQKIGRDKSKERKDPRWMLVNDPNAKPKIKLNGKDVEFTDEQLEYYKEQRRYHLEQNKDKKWTDEHKARNATERAKSDLRKKFGKSIKLTDPD